MTRHVTARMLQTVGAVCDALGNVEQANISTAGAPLSLHARIGSTVDTASDLAAIEEKLTLFKASKAYLYGSRTKGVLLAEWTTGTGVRVTATLNPVLWSEVAL